MIKPKDGWRRIDHDGNEMKAYETDGLPIKPTPPPIREVRETRAYLPGLVLMFVATVWLLSDILRAMFS